MHRVAKKREKEVVFTELAVRGGVQPSHARKTHRKASAGALSSEFQGQQDSANSKFCLWSYKDAQEKGLSCQMDQEAMVLDMPQWQRESQGDLQLSKKTNLQNYRGCRVSTSPNPSTPWPSKPRARVPH